MPNHRLDAEETSLPANLKNRFLPVLVRKAGKLLSYSWARTKKGKNLIFRSRLRRMQEELPSRKPVANLAHAIYDKNNKVIMLWSPKSGCTVSLQAMFESMNLLEEALQYYKFVHKYRMDIFYKKYGVVDLALLKQCYAFKIVRNPYARAVSSYLHLVPCYKGDKSIETTTFYDFLKILKDNNMRFIFNGRENPHATYHSMIQYDQNEEKFLDRFIKLEDKEIETKLREEANINFSLKNRTSYHHVAKKDIHCGFFGETPIGEVIQNVPRSYRYFYNKKIKSMV